MSDERVSNEVLAALVGNGKGHRISVLSLAETAYVISALRELQALRLRVAAQDEALGKVRAWCYKQIDDYDHTPYQEGLQDGAVDLLLDLALLPAAPAGEPEAGAEVTP